MNAMNWVKGVVVAVGLSLGGSAIAAGPGPMVAQNDSAGLYDRQRSHDHDNWNDRWLDESNVGRNHRNDRADRNRNGRDDRADRDRGDRHDRRMFRLGKAKIADGRALQLRGERLLERARWSRSMVMARQGHRLIMRGEALEREGRTLIRLARS